MVLSREENLSGVEVCKFFAPDTAANMFPLGSHSTQFIDARVQ